MNEKSIREINDLIGRIEAALPPDAEIGARDRATLKSLLKSSKIDKQVKFFSCQREDSAKVIHYFVKEKGLTQSRFSMNAQPDIFILY